jgi:hypothetical protein
MTFLSATPDLDTKVALINTLVSVSEGKVRTGPQNSKPAHGACTR